METKKKTWWRRLGSAWEETGAQEIVIEERSQVTEGKL